MAIREASLLGHYATPPADGDRRVPGACRETHAPDAQKPRLLDCVRKALGTRHYSRRIEKAYVHWIKRYSFFHGKRHPAEMGAAEVTAFLTSLAVPGKGPASPAAERWRWASAVVVAVCKPPRRMTVCKTLLRTSSRCSRKAR